MSQFNSTLFSSTNPFAHCTYKVAGYEYSVTFPWVTNAIPTEWMELGCWTWNQMSTDLQENRLKSQFRKPQQL